MILGGHEEEGKAILYLTVSSEDSMDPASRMPLYNLSGVLGTKPLLKSKEDAPRPKNAAFSILVRVKVSG